MPPANPEPAGPFPQETLDEIGRVESLCQRFEEEWTASTALPRIETYLAEVESSPRIRARLLRELLLLEKELRSGSGERPSAEEYLSRFGSDAAVVREVFSDRAGANDTSNLKSTQRGSRSATTALQAGARLGKFEVIEHLGRGAFGDVYLCRDSQLHRDVALKLPRAGTLDSEHEADQFLREARAAAQLAHPGIVTVFEAGQIDGHYYIASKFIRGQSLRQAMNEKRQWSLMEAAKLISQLAHALHAAHLRGVFHRDIKPENILLDEQGVPHIADFGLARRTEGELLRTQEGARLGTPAYMSPEQVAGRSHLADARSDQWALGVVLYELLTGLRPFQGTMHQVLAAIEEAEPASPSSLRRDVSLDLETICLKCLAKEPDRRYPSCQHLADDLERWLQGDSIEARPASWWEAAQKWARRHPAVASLSGLLALSLIAGLSFGLYQLNRLTEANADLVATNFKLDRANGKLTETNQKLELARVETERKRGEAETEKRIAQAVRDFLRNDLLRQASPHHQADRLRELQLGGFSASPNPTIKEVLDRAAAGIAGDRLEKKFPRQPLTQAEIMATLGQTYSQIGETAKAAEWTERALAIYRSNLGESDPKTLAMLDGLAWINLGLGKIGLAETQLNQVLALRIQTLGKDHVDTADCLESIALVHSHRGRFAEMVQVLEEALDIKRHVLGDDHEYTLQAVNNLALAYNKVRRGERAIPLLEEAVKKSRGKLGADHPLTLSIQHNLGNGYVAIGKLDEGLAILEESEKHQAAVLGDDHPTRLRALYDLGIAYDRLSKKDKAAEAFLKSYEGLISRSGANHRDTLMAQHNLAATYLEIGDLTAAIDLLADVIPRRNVVFAPNAPRILEDIANLLELCAEVGQMELALGVVAEVVRFRRQQLQGYDVNHVVFLIRLSAELLRTKQFKGAEEYLRECLALIDSKEPDVWNSFVVKSMLGEALTGQKRFADAEKLLLAGWQGLKARETKVPLDSRLTLASAARRLYDLYAAWEKPEEATKWQKELDSYK